MGKPSSLFLIILITFNCYTSLVHSTEASLIHHNKQLISLLSSKTDYVIDDVLILLSGLLKTSQNELSTLEENWPATQAEKQASVVLYQGLVISQSDQCESLSEINSDLEEQIQETEDQIEEDSARIVANNERIDVLLAARCTQNRNYLTGLKKNKQALAIIQILRDAVNNFNPSLLEKKNLKIIANKFINFIQFTSKQNIIGLTQLLDLPDVQERTSEEIGTGHVDNTEEEITVDDFDSQTIEELQSVKTKLVNILNDLEVGLQTEATTNEANEASANEELADYELNIENENNFLNTEITTLTSELGILKGQKLLSDAEVVDCQEILSGYKNSLENANKDFEDSTNNYNDNDERLQEEVALFQEIYNLYEAEVASASEQLKKEVDNDEAGESLIQIEQKI